VLVAHGDDDQIVPVGASALMTAKIVEKPTLKIYKGGCHGFSATNADELNEDLYAFIQGKPVSGAA
jgi:non-heme chloroperoxidase